MFNFYFCCNAKLTEKEIWPDGNAPENPTIEDVIKVIEECATYNIALTILNEWNLWNSSKGKMFINNELVIVRDIIFRGTGAQKQFILWDPKDGLVPTNPDGSINTSGMMIWNQDNHKNLKLPFGFSSY